MTRARWWAVAALLLGATALLWRSLKTEAAPAGLAGDSPRVKALLRERRDELRQAFKARNKEYLAGRIATDALMELSRLLVQAELEAAEKPADRVAPLQAHLEIARDTEKIVKARHDAGRAPVTDLHLARAARMDVEIALLRAKDRLPPGK
jgi:outer membrane protein TolC